MAFSKSFLVAIMLGLFCLGSVLSARGQAPDLPQTMPAPEENPQESEPAKPAAEDPTTKEPAPPPAPDQDDQALPATSPEPSQRPADAQQPEAGSPEPAPPEEATKPQQGPPTPDAAGAQSLPVAPPPPVERPADAADREATAPRHSASGGEEPKPQQGPPLPASLVGAMPETERACRAELTKLGVAFEDRGAESGEDGCSMPFPVRTSAFSAEIKVEPAVIANCAVTLEAAKFLQTTVKAAAREHLNADLTGIANGSGYVCRPRRGTQKLSEHALGNALDIMSFSLSGERQVVVEKPNGEAEAKFLAAVRAAACGPFKTVLGPGSDADHADHFHLDLADREAGATFCQ